MYRKIILLITLVLGMAMLSSGVAQADSYYPSATLYQSKEDNGHSISSGKVISFGYGSKIGRLNLTNVQVQESPINGFASYLSNDTITIGYSYDGNAYRDTADDEWHLESDSGKDVAGTALSGKIKMGTLIVQVSSSGTTWDAPVIEVDNLFTDKKLDIGNLYTISTDDLKQGKYIRVIVAYEMEKKIGEKDGLFGGSIYNNLYCTEVYQFYAGFNGNPVFLRNIMTGNIIRADGAVQSGFVIDKNGSSYTVRLKKDQDDWMEVQSLNSVTDQGKYSVEVETPLGKKYIRNVEVTEGIKTASVKATVYENKQKDKYSLESHETREPAFGLPSLSSLTVAQSGGKAITMGNYDDRDAYGITSSSVCLFINLNNAEELLDSDWKIVQDKWGKKENENINGVHVGQVDTGALIIQTSPDGKNWSDVDYGKYASGLYTTNFEAHYGGVGDILIYTPDGSDINNGLFIRVLYAYEIENKALKADNRCIEKYEFYLCSDNLDAVTFHNLSLADSMEETFGELDENKAKIYRMAETMLDGDYTASGFTIDLSGNPTAVYTVKLDGRSESSSNGKYTKTGRYEIEITSRVGSKRNLTLFVDTMSKDEALRCYFCVPDDYDYSDGEQLFIAGKRVYSDGDCPRYEGGLTKYYLQPVDYNHLPLSGYILNLKTMEKIEIPATSNAKTGILTEAGQYEAVFATREEDFTSGDRKIFTFRFDIIPKGTAPGPVVNQQELKEYACTTVSDAYPLYYSLRFQAGGKGTITLAFQNKEDAFNFAYNHEYGRVQNWDNDKVMTFHPSYNIQGSEEYDGWSIEPAVRDAAEKAIQPEYFNLTKSYNFTTIDPDYIEDHLFTDDIVNEQDYEKTVYDDLRDLYLENDVVLFAPGQREKLTGMNEAPFLISDKPYYYLDPVKGGTISHGFTDFNFIRDEHGYDSDNVTITDQNGKIHEIKYNESVGAQLAAAGCPSGVVTITEKTVYGDTASYNAVYISQGDNTAVASLSCYQNGITQAITLTQNDDGEQVKVDAVKSLLISDALDPYDLVIIEKAKVEERKAEKYVLDQLDELKFEETGTYRIKIINRLGASFSFSIDVTDPNFAAIAFSGEGAETLSEVPTQYGAHNVILPEPQREGYYFVGFEDQSGKLYNGEIEEITFRGEQILNVVWKAKQFKATFNNPDGSTNTIEVEYDSQIMLPIPEVPEGKKFDGWMVDGKLLDSNLYTLKSEKDISFVASVSDESAIAQAIDSITSFVAENTSVAVIGVAGVLALIILIARSRSRGKRRRR